MTLALYLALSVIVFLITLNGYLRGSKKVQIDTVLSVFLIGIIISFFVVTQWYLGVVAIVFALILGILFQPLAAKAALKFFALSGEGRYPGFPSPRLQAISRKLGKQSNLDDLTKELLGGGKKSEDAEKALLDYCEGLKEVRRIMEEYNISRSELSNMYSKLIMAGAGRWACGHWVAASALAYPEAFKYLVSRKDHSDVEKAANLVMYFERGKSLE